VRIEKKQILLFEETLIVVNFEVVGLAPGYKLVTWVHTSYVGTNVLHGYKLVTWVKNLLLG
jgi:hypothetical protein